VKLFSSAARHLSPLIIPICVDAYSVKLSMFGMFGVMPGLWGWQVGC
jgi:hypothetical protein